MNSNSTLRMADVCGMLRRACDATGGVSTWAKAKGISPSYVADVVAGRSGPGPAVLAALGLRRVTRYVISHEQD